LDFFNEKQKSDFFSEAISRFQHSLFFTEFRKVINYLKKQLNNLNAYRIKLSIKKRAQTEASIVAKLICQFMAISPT
jgi:hypothetical protein